MAGNVTSSYAEVYPAGTFSVKPININFSSFTFGLREPDSKISSEGRSPRTGVLETTNFRDDVYKTPLSLGFHESDRNGYGYGIELGYVIGWNTEILLRAGASREKGKKIISIAERTFDFDARNNYGFALGARKYFDCDKTWRPFIGVVAGFTVQGATKALVREHNPFTFLLYNDPAIGKFTLLKQKTLYNFEVHAGTDYLFNETWALTFNVGLRYGQRGGSSSITTPGLVTTPARVVNYMDNRDRWFVPITVSLKIIF